MSSEGKATSVRLNKADFMKLSRMANATARSRSSVIRYLIRLAEVSDIIRIRLDESPCTENQIQNMAPNSEEPELGSKSLIMLAEKRTTQRNAAVRPGTAEGEPT